VCVCVCIKIFVYPYMVLDYGQRPLLKNTEDVNYT